MFMIHEQFHHSKNCKFQQECLMHEIYIISSSCYRMGQNMNMGIQYFKDILFVESEIAIASIVWNVSLTEAEYRLYPRKWRKKSGLIVRDVLDFVIVLKVLILFITGYCCCLLLCNKEVSQCYGAIPFCLVTLLSYCTYKSRKFCIYFRRHLTLYIVSISMHFTVYAFHYFACIVKNYFSSVFQLMLSCKNYW